MKRDGLTRPVDRRRKPRTGKERFGFLGRDIVGVELTTTAALSLIAFATAFVVILAVFT